MIIICNGILTIMEVFNPFVYQVYVYGHRIFISTIGKRSLNQIFSFHSLSSADDNFEGTMKTNLVIQHNGSILLVPPGILKSICTFNIASFPFVSIR